MSASWSDIQDKMIVVLEVEGHAYDSTPTVGLHWKELIRKVTKRLQKEGSIGAEDSDIDCVFHVIDCLLALYHENRNNSLAIHRVGFTTFWLSKKDRNRTIMLNDSDWPPCGRQR